MQAPHESERQTPGESREPDQDAVQEVTVALVVQKPSEENEEQRYESLSPFKVPALPVDSNLPTGFTPPQSIVSHLPDAVEV